MQSIIEVFSDGKQLRSYSAPLKDGELGTLQALDVAAQFVRRDRLEPDLRKFVLREIIREVPGHDYKGEIKSCFEYARDRIVYRRDPVGVERVADLWSTMYALSPGEPEGDCLVKSTFLATCLALLGNTPYFAVIKQLPTDVAYRHVYVVLDDGTALDPTPQDATVGWQAPHTVLSYYAIF